MLQEPSDTRIVAERGSNGICGLSVRTRTFCALVILGGLCFRVRGEVVLDNSIQHFGTVATSIGGDCVYAIKQQLVDGCSDRQALGLGSSHLKSKWHSRMVYKNLLAFPYSLRDYPYGGQARSSDYAAFPLKNYSPAGDGAYAMETEFVFSTPMTPSEWQEKRRYWLWYRVELLDALIRKCDQSPADLIQLFRCIHREDEPKMEELKKAAIAFDALPESLRRKILNGWTRLETSVDVMPYIRASLQHPLVVGTMILAPHADGRQWVQPTVFLTHDSPVEVQIRAGTSKAEAIALLLKTVQTIDQNWDTVTCHGRHSEGRYVGESKSGGSETPVIPTRASKRERLTLEPTAA